MRTWNFTRVTFVLLPFCQPWTWFTANHLSKSTNHLWQLESQRQHIRFYAARKIPLPHVCVCVSIFIKWVVLNTYEVYALPACMIIINNYICTSRVNYLWRIAIANISVPMDGTTLIWCDRWDRAQLSDNFFRWYDFCHNLCVCEFLHFYDDCT